MTNSKNNTNNNQLPPCLPSQLLPESASALTTQLLSCRLLWSVCSDVFAAPCVSEETCGSHAEHTASSYYAHPRSRDGKHGATHSAVTAPTTQPTLWCHFINPYHRLNTRPPQQQLIVQLLLPDDWAWKLSSSTSVFSWKKRCHRSSRHLWKKRHKDL